MERRLIECRMASKDLLEGKESERDLHKLTLCWHKKV